MNDKLSGLSRYLTTFERADVDAAARVTGYKLIGGTPEGYPIFESVEGPLECEQLVYETPLFEEFIPETFH
jgi:hypothetical protein